MAILSYSSRRELPPKPGIYYIGNSVCPVMYIGLSCNLKNRHINHHRQAQFENIENAVIQYRLLTDDLLAKITDLRKVLIRLERQAINYYKPPLNNTPIPEQPVFTTSQGSIYIQTHNVSKAGYCGHFDGQDGDELGIDTGKLSMLMRAIKEKRPVFLITSGYYEDYDLEGYSHLSELVYYRNDRIFLLASRFIPYGYEQSNYFCNKYLLYGATSKVFINPYAILNNRPGFEEFKRSYLRLGFTNCERSPFAKQLLYLEQLGRNNSST
ncbi:MAG: hypothetical protein RID09_00660 [Coleofasciculus sp. G1-WW12-02]|uniref:hypothetical protein n=1 Tax=Coleofasciculus sp. G1-WW12-02 TaxID=3068483 RepID=UPI0032FD9133